MNSRRFPRSPEITPRPFDGGSNPFADDDSTPIPISDNPLQAPLHVDVQPYKPGDYVETLPDRSIRVFWYGAIGGFLIALSLIIGVVVLSSTPWGSTALVYCLPTNLLGLAFTIPAWTLASNDIRAVNAGAMTPAGKSRTRIGYWCGLIGTLVGIAPFVLIVLVIIGSMLS